MVPMFRRLNQKDETKLLVVMPQLTVGTDHHESFSQQRGKPKERGKVGCVAASEREERKHFGFLSIQG